MPHHCRTETGVTLIELLIVLAIAAVLGCIAVPSLRRLRARHAVVRGQIALAGALHATRDYAIEHGIRTLLCPSRDGRHCDRDIHWEHGWLIAYDRDGDGRPDGAPISVHAALPVSVTALGSRGRERVHYFADGGAPGSNLSLTICSTGSNGHGEGVTVSNTGRIRHSHPDRSHLRRCLRAAR